MTIEQMFNAMSAGMRAMRTDYHLTLGDAIAKLRKIDSGAIVKFDYDESLSPADVDSYRGYYEDLAIEPSETQCRVLQLLSMLESALGETFTGYKGGDFLMKEDTPLWCADYGDCGRAITGLRVEGREVVLETKDTEGDE